MQYIDDIKRFLIFFLTILTFPIWFIKRVLEL